MYAVLPVLDAPTFKITGGKTTQNIAYLSQRWLSEGNSTNTTTPSGPRILAKVVN